MTKSVLQVALLVDGVERAPGIDAAGLPTWDPTLAVPQVDEDGRACLWDPYAGLPVPKRGSVTAKYQGRNPPMPLPQKVHYSGGLKWRKPDGTVCWRARGFGLCCSGDMAYVIRDRGNQTDELAGVTCKKCLAIVESAKGREE